MILLRFPTSEKGLNNSAGLSELCFSKVSLTDPLEKTMPIGQKRSASHFLRSLKMTPATTD